MYSEIYIEIQIDHNKFIISEFVGGPSGWGEGAGRTRTCPSQK